MKPMLASFAALMLLWTGACSEVRRHTYPAEFHYLERKDLSNSMWTLAIDVAELDRLLKGEEWTTGSRRLEIISRLKDMESAASKLHSGGQQTNHPQIDRHMDLFIQDLATARAAAEQTPPNYFLTGRVTGSCAYCHGPSPYPRNHE